MKYSPEGGVQDLAVAVAAFQAVDGLAGVQRLDPDLVSTGR
jgi:hypothetical protein